VESMSDNLRVSVSTMVESSFCLEADRLSRYRPIDDRGSRREED
jgi:hypothetical protein